MLLASTVACLLALETALRIYHGATLAQDLRRLPPVNERAMIPSDDPALIYEWNPDWTESDFHVNAFGMVGEEVSFEKPDGVFRIAVVGDSISANFGLIPQSESYVALLRDAFANNVDYHGPVEILNFAVNGYSLLQEARLVESQVLRFDPDLVLVQLCLNDPYPTPIAPYTESERMGSSRLWNFVERRVAPRRFWASVEVSSKYDAEGTGNIRSGIQRLAEASRRGLPVVAVLFPYLYEPAYSRWDFALHHAVYRDAATAVGLPLLDLYEPFRAAGLVTTSTDLVDPIHPPPEGHSLAASEILVELDRLGLLPEAN